LALARKVIILDLKETTFEQMLGLAALALALGIAYWLTHERDDRHRPAEVLEHGSILPKDE
jgi:uncharacterized membrane protein (DUF373 family)